MHIKSPVQDSTVVRASRGLENKIKKRDFQ